MSTTNKIILVGPIGHDPQDDPERDAVSASLCTIRRDPDGTEERRDWHRLVFPGKLRAFATEHIRKGDRLYVEGRMEYDHYDRDGIMIPTAEVVGREVVLLHRDGAPLATADEGEV